MNIPEIVPVLLIIVVVSIFLISRINRTTQKLASSALERGNGEKATDVTELGCGLQFVVLTVIVMAVLIILYTLGAGGIK